MNDLLFPWAYTIYLREPIGKGKLGILAYGNVNLLTASDEEAKTMRRGDSYVFSAHPQSIDHGGFLIDLKDIRVMSVQPVKRSDVTIPPDHAAINERATIVDYV